MAFNKRGAGPGDVVEVPLSVFGSLVTEMTAQNCPEGVSPDCQDVEFVPGSVYSRRCLRRVFNPPAYGGPQGPFPGNVTVNYAKSFVNALGVIENLYLTSDGALYLENLTTAPGSYTKIAQTTPGSYAKSTTAFDREYIAISDGLHGAEVPLQWDGTNLDRVTQDGPGAAPTVVSIALPSVQMFGGGVLPPVLTIDGIYPDQNTGGFFTALNIYAHPTPELAAVGQTVTVAGTPYDGDYPVILNPGPGGAITVSAFFPSSSSPYVGAGTLTIGTGIAGTTMTRTSNLVTVTTATEHNLQVGYRAQITKVPADVISAISSIVVNNDDAPGLALVTTAVDHGLVPGLFVSLTGVPGVNVGGGISSIARAGGVVTVTTASAHNLVPGAVVTLTGVGAASFNTTGVVAQVPGSTAFTFAQTDTDATSSGGTVALNWPIPETTNPTYFEILSAPSARTFQVQLNYASGTWTGGTVRYAWDGTFFVSSVIDALTFQYQQYGPDSTSTATGTVTPFGQAAPGQHQLQVMFLTRNGAITKPSPPVSFIANGGQYISVTNIPIGPTDAAGKDIIVARILAFTGAQGAYFFYIPAPALSNGQQVSTATQINDNTTQAALLDFSDNTLFTATAVSITGNNLASQIVLDGALGFGLYGSRLLTFGQRNRLQNLLAMSFDGGYLPSIAGIPAGWTNTDASGTLAAGHFGQGWLITAPNDSAPYGVLSQSMYRDAYGAPIATPNTRYRFRVWLQPSILDTALIFVAQIKSAATGFLSQVTIHADTMELAGGFLDAEFSDVLPAVIPPDLSLTIYAQNGSAAAATLLVDELSVIYAQTPYTDTLLFGSYVNNPEAFDGLTGKFGSTEDVNKVMDFTSIRRVLYFLTQDPGGRIHQTNDNGVTEPAGWTIDQVATECGLVSTFALAKSQADSTTGSGGEEWFSWLSSTGPRIFGGSIPWRIGPEITPDFQALNPAARLFAWHLNDPDGRIMWFGIPTGDAMAPNIIYPMSYRQLDTAEQIASSAPYRVGMSGKLICSDNTRKWTRWNLAMNGAALMYREAGKLQPVFLCGKPFGQVYTLGPTDSTDEDYGQVFPYYFTYFFVGGDKEQMLGLGGGLKLLMYVSTFITSHAACFLDVTFYPNNMATPWPLTVRRELMAPEFTRFDIECAGGNAIGQNIAIKYQSTPRPETTDNGFNLQSVSASLRAVRHLPVRGAAK